MTSCPKLSHEADVHSSAPLLNLRQTLPAPSAGSARHGVGRSRRKETDMGDLLGEEQEDVGTLPICKACGSERVARAAWVCWNAQTGLWEVEDLQKQVRCQNCDSVAELTWKRVDGAVSRQRVRELNDAFRERCEGTGTIVVTQGISDLGPNAMREILDRVRTFEDFSEENDPWGEHDFGAFDHDEQKIFWKIDCYDRDRQAGSPNPGNPAVTHRVLTIMLAQEY